MSGSPPLTPGVSGGAPPPPVSPVMTSTTSNINATTTKRPSPPSGNVPENDMMPAAKRPKLAVSHSMPPPTTTPTGSPVLHHLPPYNSPSSPGMAGSTVGRQSESPVGGNTPVMRANTLPQTPGGGAKEDPNDFSDALLSAGVDLREEEQLLSSSIPIRSQSFKAGGAGAPGGLLGPIPTLTDDELLSTFDMTPDDTLHAHRRTPFLDLHVLRQVVATVALENDIHPPPFTVPSTVTETKDNDALVLISLACQEWLSNILTSAIITSRYRRESGNSMSNASEVAKALRQIAIKDKEAEDKYKIAQAALEARSGAAGVADGSGKAHDSARGAHATEEVMHRAANATAAMMVSGGRKRYSWMTSGGSGSNSPSAGGAVGGGSKKDSTTGGHGIRLREAKEEQSVVMRDLLTVLEDERIGVQKVLTKGWTRLRD
ncbi:transcription initiation factor TFIID component TAF4 family-domain-containing protein [Lipomyces tetrasporus]|uniref:Transcription initiation factor TFIID subunit 4 n=1 Tax=Lipomyces tetrasporus TaxID=54092 RepID=A0AAD7QUH5_9ASCO|nr:transcription initiation factor TFIID component TAF4 family-domain-containing protein [Lipomyces tetrasporus]KAJ8101674.1 transcription initiation factor TFIID component TAF4 family-domain-containing protein [Lipomyces tetrasporus]